MKLPEVLLSPELPPSLSNDAKWLAGEGAGSWFLVDPISAQEFSITRFDPQGNVECKGVFRSTENLAIDDNDFEITYPSHCALVTILQHNQKQTLIRVS